MLDIAAKRLGTSEVTYQVCFKMIASTFYWLSCHQQDVWKFRSRLVHGKEGSLTIDAWTLVVFCISICTENINWHTYVYYIILFIVVLCFCLYQSVYAYKTDWLLMKWLTSTYYTGYCIKIYGLFHVQLCVLLESILFYFLRVAVSVYYSIISGTLNVSLEFDSTKEMSSGTKDTSDSDVHVKKATPLPKKKVTIVKRLNWTFDVAARLFYLKQGNAYWILVLYYDFDLLYIRLLRWVNRSYIKVDQVICRLVSVISPALYKNLNRSNSKLNH